MTPLIEARQITKIFTGGALAGSSRRVTVALEDASIMINQDPPAIITIAGESGSGKTTLSRLLLGLIQPTAGQIYYQGKALSEMDQGARRAFREKVQAIYQDPFEVYNPFYKVDRALELPLRSFRPYMSRAQRRDKIEETLEGVGLRPRETLGRHAHQLSGGQRQRVMVARALLLDPSIIVADEPVSMVDASLRATILENLLNAHRERGISLIYISHDLTTAYQISQTILMLYQGTTVEAGDVDLVIKKPQHPYTQLLMSCIPLPDPKHPWGGGLEDEGVVERAAGRLKGCKFADRCPRVMPMCSDSPPPLYGTDEGRGVACYLYRDAPVLDDREVLALYTPG
jgi:oligopeptide/dipeptide ABC transporter ATP-binding protein